MRHFMRRLMILILAGCTAVAPAFAEPLEPAGSDAAGPPPVSGEELEQLVAPIALYPDSLLAQVLMAATYPLEVVSAARWVKDNPKVAGKDLDAAMAKQPWDASVKSLTAFPRVLQMMNEKLDWTEKLGNVFLAQQKDTMDAVQRLRAKAQAQGALNSGKEQTVSTQKSAGASDVIVIQPTQPDVIYVPAYNPMTVYGPWPYPAYQPFAWYPPGYTAAGNLLSFGLGVAAGAALWSDVDWRHGDVDININRYENYTHISAPDNWKNNNGQWRHDPRHRKGVPYRDGDTERRFRGGDGSRDMERQKAREAFRGRDGGPAEHGGLPGGGGQRLGADGHGQRVEHGDRGQRIGAGDHGQRRDDIGAGGRVNRRDISADRHTNRGGNRSAFHGMESGGQAHIDKARGAGSRKAMYRGGGSPAPRRDGGGHAPRQGGARPHRR